MAADLISLSGQNHSARISKSRQQITHRPKVNPLCEIGYWWPVGIGTQQLGKPVNLTTHIVGRLVVPQELILPWSN
jgi:hypothetical protein